MTMVSNCKNCSHFAMAGIQALIYSVSDIQFYVGLHHLPDCDKVGFHPLFPRKEFSLFSFTSTFFIDRTHVWPTSKDPLPENIFTPVPFFLIIRSIPI
jgi:hypothetical protein